VRVSFSDAHLPPCPASSPASTRSCERRSAGAARPPARREVLRDDLARYLATGQGVAQTDESRTQMVSLTRSCSSRRPPGRGGRLAAAAAALDDDDDDETNARPGSSTTKGSSTGTR